MGLCLVMSKVPVHMGDQGVCLNRYFNRWGGVFAKLGKLGFLLQQRTMKWGFQRCLQAALWVTPCFPNQACSPGWTLWEILGMLQNPQGWKCVSKAASVY